MNSTFRIGIFVLIIAALVVFVLTRDRNKAEVTPVGQNPITVTYACNEGKTITAQYYQGTTTPAVAGQPPVPNGRAEVVLSDGRSMTLPQTLSADGARYANTDESFVFWSKGNGALVLENNTQKSFIGCVMVKSDAGGLPQVYHGSAGSFSVRYPTGYTVNEAHQYPLAPQKNIFGVRFTVPAATVQGTNLGSDTYVSVESLPQAASCSANLFLSDQSVTAKTVTEDGTEYSVASSMGAGAGNRYEETVYALPGTNPCMAVRFFVHYGVIENYPAGSVKEFNKTALLQQFESIRRSLVVNH